MAARLDPENKDCAKQLAAARAAAEAQQTLEDELAKARKKSTIRQAHNQMVEAEYQARLEAKRTGKIKDMGGWTEQMKKVGTHMELPVLTLATTLATTLLTALTTAAIITVTIDCVYRWCCHRYDHHLYHRCPT